MAEMIVLAATMLLVGALMYYLPVMKGPDGFFGIPVSDEFYQGPIARGRLMAYRLITVLLVAGGAACLLNAPALGLATPGGVLTIMLVAFLGPMVPLIVIWRGLRPHEARPELPAEGVREEQPDDRWRFVSPSVEVLLLGGLLVLLGLTVWRYPALPERIPIHWNAAGQADGWTSKSPWPLASLLVMLAFMHGMLLALVVGMGQLRVRLPAQRAEEYREARERYLRVSAQGMNALRIGILVMFSGIIWASVFGIERQAEGVAPPGMTMVWIGTAILLLSIVWLIARGVQVRREMREIAGPGMLESAAPTAGWVWGMFYCNRDDPSLWVEKRLGIGWTVNFAHRAAWVIVGLAVGIPLGVAALALLAGNQ
ncbi:MAG: DUF1648 domain-containing protein [Armatimonadetes bacterium]|nr:DUF1648 domain-containing protein [Armatimonadota bacterium]